MEVSVSVDKIIIAYIGISLELFNTYIAKKLCDFYHTRVKPNDSKAFHYTVYLPENDGHYLHLSYKLLSEPKSLRYTLWAETHPDSMETFMQVFEVLSQNAREIHFVKCDVAFDIPHHKSNILLVHRKGKASNDNRNTTYFGKKSERRKHGYCRFYDKRLQLEEKKNIIIDGELSRIEVVYRPEARDRFSMSDLLDTPPAFINSRYQCHILTDIDQLPHKKRTLVQALMSREKRYKDISYYMRGELRKALDSTQLRVDFDTIAAEQWKAVINPYVSLACG
ncbi:hypothetical protein IMX26_03655 [Clostridium sp. 'deep sea']|uniref:hypothetical protein n=1 Tax=Clostridium sp. 'deep sea' TaxID=2779445 RepID=UPI0018968609|nr:hypothetical protein [Clostridium sp. 'deep sea']QOR35926.1 hypothetical protein IMX26_03655 [Clostridium sp. 'deep sea']